jgi:hypothetical protein
MDGRPLSRLVFGIRYAVGLLRSARRIASELGPVRSFNHQAEAIAVDRPQPAVPARLSEKDAVQAWSLGTNCLLYEADRGPELLNVGTQRYPLMVPRSQAWEQGYVLPPSLFEHPAGLAHLMGSGHGR